MSKGHGAAQRWILDYLAANGACLISDLGLLYMTERSIEADRVVGDLRSAQNSVRRAVASLEDERLVETGWVGGGSRARPVKAVRLLTWEDTLPQAAGSRRTLLVPDLQSQTGGSQE